VATLIRNTWQISAGILSVQVPTTWQEFQDVSKKLRAAGYAPIGVGLRDVWPATGWFDALDLSINGPAFHLDLLHGKASYLDPRVTKVFEAWRTLIQESAFMNADQASSYTFDSATTLLAQGKVAMELTGSYIYGTYPKSGLSDLGFFAFPKIDPSVPSAVEAPADGWIIPKNSTHQQLAKLFVGVAGDQKAEEVLATRAGLLVPRSDVNMSVYPPYMQDGFKFVQKADYLTQWYNRDTAPLLEQAFPYMVDFMHNPSDIGSIEKKLQALQDRAFPSK